MKINRHTDPNIRLQIVCDGEITTDTVQRWPTIFRAFTDTAGYDDRRINLKLVRRDEAGWFTYVFDDGTVFKAEYVK